jgi:hypothetical protein
MANLNLQKSWQNTANNSHAALGQKMTNAQTWRSQ